ncbi:Membrane-associated phosphatidylinositol transfer protein 2 [Tyrophagus putrescentiae]|nr:Membrane-associated phosphatidylinositol transfer protein 2 [Tyrophagus putrescentiae]
MLIKEYRIPLPLSVEEYKIAQLYMIAKKSREESQGTDCGVEIIQNEPYTDGPGGSGQYTFKKYHVGTHLPAWLKAILPKSALIVEEMAWNAYPYTKTRYLLPVVNKFSIEIETRYYDDCGNQSNVFNCSETNRQVDFIDIVKDQVSPSKYNREEDPRYFKSTKTGRGPLSENWINEYWNNGKPKQSIMCAYKLCRVEFKYWGMQSKIEQFIDDIALRNTMVQAHQQAWTWQDEWVGLTMADIRHIELETQLFLQQRMNAQGQDPNAPALPCNNNNAPIENLNEERSGHQALSGASAAHLADMSSIDKDNDAIDPVQFDVPKSKKNSLSQYSLAPSHLSKDGFDEAAKRKSAHWSRSNSRSTLHSPGDTFDVISAWRMQSLARDSDSSSDEFYDAEDVQDENSPNCLSRGGFHASSIKETEADNIFSAKFLQQVQSDIISQSKSAEEVSQPDSPTSSLTPNVQCPISTLIIILHGGSILDVSNEANNSKSTDISTFGSTLDTVVRQHYSNLIDRIAIRYIACPAICNDSLMVLSSLSPYCGQNSTTPAFGSIPIGALPLFAISSFEYQENVVSVIAQCNKVFADFSKSEEGRHFSGKVVLIGDSVGAILGFDALCHGTSSQAAAYGSELSIQETADTKLPLQASNPIISITDSLNSLPVESETSQGASPDQMNALCKSRTLPTASTVKGCTYTKQQVYCKSLSHPGDVIHSEPSTNRLLISTAIRRRSSGSSDLSSAKLEFEVNDFFMFGSMLGIVLTYRKMLSLDDKAFTLLKPACANLYNLFHPSDPSALRIEPLLSARFSYIAPVSVPRYQKFPLGDVMARWWGSKRIDYALYCPEGLSNFPTHSLPHIFHSSYWESSDVISFILRQINKLDAYSSVGAGTNDTREVIFKPNQPREKWQRKRTSVKIKAHTANHRANDVIVKESMDQVITGRFAYGPLDMIALTGEKVDIHMRCSRTGDWNYVATVLTDKNGRLSYTVPREKILPCGLYQFKMVVRGDHTSLDLFMAVVPAKTEAVVFSIDGSLTASVSVSGRDPKVRAGSIDVVRFWQELGYLIIYITGRPDMQQQRVVSWLSQHNFPHGLIFFMDGFNLDPLRQKTEYLKNLEQKMDIIFRAAYGSNKDIGVYKDLDMKPEQIYTVGKASKKQQELAISLEDGYVAHLEELKANGLGRPAQSNASRRAVLPRGGFSGLRSKPSQKAAKRTISYPVGVGNSSSSSITITNTNNSAHSTSNVHNAL